MSLLLFVRIQPSQKADQLFSITSPYKASVLWSLCQEVLATVDKHNYFSSNYLSLCNI